MKKKPVEIEAFQYMEDYTDDEKILQAAELALIAMERQYPKKPVMRENMYEPYADFLCPKCKKLVCRSRSIEVEPNFCSRCGQRLDWEEYLWIQTMITATNAPDTVTTTTKMRTER